MVNNYAANVRAQPSRNSTTIFTFTREQAMNVIGQTRGDDGERWYRVRVALQDGEIVGWIRYDLVTEITECPALGQ
jgi:hypothetical protein